MVPGTVSTLKVKTSTIKCDLASGRSSSAFASTDFLILDAHTWFSTPVRRGIRCAAGTQYFILIRLVKVFIVDEIQGLLSGFIYITHPFLETPYYCHYRPYEAIGLATRHQFLQHVRSIVLFHIHRDLIGLQTRTRQPQTASPPSSASPSARYNATHHFSAPPAGQHRH